MGPETGDTSRDGETGRETGRDTYKDERDTVVRKNFKFGKRVHNEPRLHEHEVWDFLKCRDEAQWKPESGLRETKFHRGFHRRQQKDILVCNPMTRNDRQVSHVNQERKSKLAVLNNNCHGYNIVNGVPPNYGIPVNPLQTHPSFGRTSDESHGRRHFQEEGERAQKSYPRIQHRDQTEYSEFKFFKQPPVSKNAIARKQIISKEGLFVSEKKSATIGYGRADLSSRGVADNFAYARCRSVPML